MVKRNRRRLSVEEQNRRLWKASEEYLRGDIPLSELNARERRYGANYTSALIALERRRDAANRGIAQDR